MDNKPQLGVITEQGDLGLGFNPIKDEEAQVIKEQQENKKEK